MRRGSEGCGILAPKGVVHITTPAVTASQRAVVMTDSHVLTAQVTSPNLAGCCGVMLVSSEQSRASGYRPVLANNAPRQHVRYPRCMLPPRRQAAHAAAAMNRPSAVSGGATRGR